MPLLKKSVIEGIYRALTNQYFTAADFEVSFPDKGGSYVTITFRHEPRFTFTITDAPRGVQSIVDGRSHPATVEIPGDFKLKETQLHETFDQCVDRIPNWCHNIHTDLRAKAPILGEFEDLREQFEKHIKDHLTDPEGRFSTEELRRLTEKFDELYQQLAALKERHEITEEELKEIRREFDAIKRNAADYSKSIWANLTKNRVVTILSKLATSKEARQLMYEGAKKMLGWG